MEIPLNADVHCPDGRCGRSSYLILNPTTEQLTHLVVKEQWPSRTERLVPVDWVAVTTRDVIVLKKSREEFTQLNPFTQTDFVYRDVPHLPSDPKVTMFWPYVMPGKRIVDQEVRRIPPGELALRRGARVQATDGRVGQIDELLVDPQDEHITHLVLREGHLWGEKVVTIPIAQIDHIEEKVVYLKVNKKSIEKMPAISVKRNWR